MIGIIWKNMKGYKKYVWLCCIGSLFEVTCSLMVPTLVYKIFDVGIVEQNKGYITRIGFIMSGFAIAAMIVGIGNAYGSATVAQGLGANLRNHLFEKIMYLSAGDIDRFSAASLITRLSSDVIAVQIAALQFMRSVLYAFYMIIMALVLAFRLNWHLAMIIVIGIIIFSLVLTIIFHFAIPQFSDMQKSTEHLNQVTQENISAQRVVKAFVSQENEETKFRRPNHDLQRISGSVMGLMLLIMPLSILMMNIGVVSILWFGGTQTGINGSIGIGELNTFLSYALQTFGALMLLALMTAQIGRAVISMKRIIQVLETHPEVIDSAKDNIHHIMSGELSFERVSFKYTEDDPIPALSGIDISIPTGQFFAVLGSTGEGKSTLTKLVYRMYNATEGNVLIDKQNINAYTLKELRENIGVVPQKNVLFRGTIKDNIRWGKEGASDEEIVNACKAAQIHTFIMSLPKAYETQIEQGGSNLSGGQRQRLCIARTLIKNPKILILDDSTSALDTLTEKNIQSMLQEQYKDTTILLIAQKITSVMCADKILVLDKGKVMGIGKHEDLLKNNSIYQEIYESQKGAIA